MWTPAEVLTMVRLSPGPLVSSFEDVFVLCFGLRIVETKEITLEVHYNSFNHAICVEPVSISLISHLFCFFEEIQN